MRQPRVAMPGPVLRANGGRSGGQLMRGGSMRSSSQRLGGSGMEYGGQPGGLGVIR